MDMKTEEALRVIGLCEMATPGEWRTATRWDSATEWETAFCGGPCDEGQHDEAGKVHVVSDIEDYCYPAEDDAAAITAAVNFARTHLPDLVAEMDTIERDRDAALHAAKRHMERVDELLAENERLRRDAERYRHLRSNESSGAVDLCICRVEWSHKSGNDRARYEVIAEDRADAAVDAARRNDEAAE